MRGSHPCPRCGRPRRLHLELYDPDEPFTIRCVARCRCRRPEPRVTTVGCAHEWAPANTTTEGTIEVCRLCGTTLA